MYDAVITATPSPTTPSDHPNNSVVITWKFFLNHVDPASPKAKINVQRYVMLGGASSSTFSGGFIDSSNLFSFTFEPHRGISTSLSCTVRAQPEKSADLSTAAIQTKESDQMATGVMLRILKGREDDALRGLPPQAREDECSQPYEMLGGRGTSACHVAHCYTAMIPDPIRE